MAARVRGRVVVGERVRKGVAVRARVQLLSCGYSSARACPCTFV